MYLLCFILAMITPVAAFVVGLYWRISPPAFGANGLAYRTALTMRGAQSWDFAHQTCAKLWLRLGLMFGVLSAVVMVVFRAHYLSFILWLLVAQMVFFCISVFFVDLLLKHGFDEQGNRIS